MRITRVVVLGLLLIAACRGSGRLYDPQADAWRQLQAAGQRAGRSNRRVLAVVGGNW
jgi:hypothetical protein